jgi:hypothetical protein
VNTLNGFVHRQHAGDLTPPLVRAAMLRDEVGQHALFLIVQGQLCAAIPQVPLTTGAEVRTKSSVGLRGDVTRDADVRARVEQHPLTVLPSNVATLRARCGVNEGAL